jgi:2-polyprenyl-3-methyl-5-hydroxy-6-metoxy-1,4-benzoquinol methylase
MKINFYIKEDSWGNLKRLCYINSVLHKYKLINENILEIGCGSGDHISLPLGRIGYSILGIDIHNDSIRYANDQKRMESIKNVKFVCKIASEIKSESYGVVICSEVLEHLDNPQKMLREITRILKKGGIAIISVPNGYGSYEIGEDISKIYRKYVRPVLISKGIHRYIQPISKIIFVEEIISKSLVPGGSLNEDSPHVQRFRFSNLQKIFRDEGLVVEDAVGRTLLNGWIISSIIEKSKSLVKLNSVLVDYLPLFICSGWLVTISKGN